MKFCKVGLHKWVYTSDECGRWCEMCHKRQELDDTGKWIDHEGKRVEKKKYCECPRDYTVSIRLMNCPHCGLPRQPRALPNHSPQSR